MYHLFSLQRIRINRSPFRLIAFLLALIPLGILARPSRAYPPVRMASMHHIKAGFVLSDDDYEEALESFIDQIDSDRTYLTEDDVERLEDLEEKYRGTGGLEFIDGATALYSQRIKQYIDTLQALQDRPMEFVDDSLELSDADFGSAEELKQRVNRSVRFDIMKRVFFAGLPANFAEFQKALQSDSSRLQKEVIRARLAHANDLLHHPDGLRDHLYFLHSAALLAQFDPHTTILGPSDAKRFQRSLSEEGETFGLTLDRGPLGEIKILRVFPGGSAWKSGKVNPGDVLLEVHVPESNRTIFGADYSAYRLQEMLDELPQDEAVFRLRKPDSSLVNVKLSKEKLKLEENTVSGYVLSGKRKIGYIYLPSFYESWDDTPGPASSSDVAGEIIKLKRDGIDGLILDLRGNGGGSRAQAADLCGLFIDVGPLFLGKAGEHIEIFKDPNRGAVYRGPLIVLVDGYSASASEFFAATMKDYNRALIVGGQTFGKATSQSMIPYMDPLVKKPAFLNVTTLLFYHLDGKSHQGEGIKPDIALPSFGEGMRESDLPHALVAGTINKPLPFEKHPAPPLDKLRDKSETRQSNNEELKKLKKVFDELDDVGRPPDTIPLEPSEFYEAISVLRPLLQRLESQPEYRTSIYKARLQKFDEKAEELSSYSKLLADERIKNLESDPWLEETYNIMNDYIDIEGKK